MYQFAFTLLADTTGRDFQIVVTLANPNCRLIVVEFAETRVERVSETQSRTSQEPGHVK